jgi:hypothetical protein
MDRTLESRFSLLLAMQQAGAMGLDLEMRRDLQRV